MTGKLYALLIGINDYQSRLLGNLRCAVADVYGVRELLQDRMGLVKDRCRFLISDASPGVAAPLRAEVLAELDAFTEAPMTPEDTFLFYYAGHGFTDKEKTSYLMTADSNPASSDLLQDTAISIPSLNRYLDRVKACQQLIILDACRNEPGTLGRDSGSKPLDATMARDIGVLAKGESGQESEFRVRNILSACWEGQLSYEFPDENHSWFCFNLLESLRQHPGPDISVVDLAEEICNRMKNSVWLCLREASSQKPHVVIQGGAIRLGMGPLPNQPDQDAGPYEKSKVEVTETKFPTAEASMDASAPKAESPDSNLTPPAVAFEVVVQFDARQQFETDEDELLDFWVTNVCGRSLEVTLTVEVGKVKFSNGTERQSRSLVLASVTDHCFSFEIETGPRSGRRAIRHFRLNLTDFDDASYRSSFEISDDSIRFRVVKPGQTTESVSIEGGIHLENIKNLGSEVQGLIHQAIEKRPRQDHEPKWVTLPLRRVEPEALPPSDQSSAVFQLCAVVRHQVMTREIHGTEVKGIETLQVPAEMGSLRSVSTGMLLGKNVLLIGTRNGVSLLNENGEVERNFSLPKRQEQSKNGVSRAAICHGMLYARHQAYGIWGWGLDATDSGQCISGNGRSFVTAMDDSLWFAAGDTARCTANQHRLVTGTKESIRFLANGEKALYGMDRRGRILCWTRPFPSNASLVHMISNPGFSLDVCSVDGREFVLFPDGPVVYCKALDGSGEIRAFTGGGGRLSLAAGTDGLIAALDWGTKEHDSPKPTTVYLWDWTEPNKPFMVWPVRAEADSHVQDILLWKR